jgi:hypothetical protein
MWLLALQQLRNQNAPNVVGNHASETDTSVLLWLQMRCSVHSLEEGTGRHKGDLLTMAPDYHSREPQCLMCRLRMLFHRL